MTGVANIKTWRDHVMRRSLFALVGISIDSLCYSPSKHENFSFPSPAIHPVEATQSHEYVCPCRAQTTLGRKEVRGVMRACIRAWTSTHVCTACLFFVTTVHSGFFVPLVVLGGPPG